MSPQKLGSELKDFFDLNWGEDEEQLTLGDGLPEVKATCKTCGRSWAILPLAKGSIDKGSETSLLQHAKAHFTQARMRKL